MSHLTQVITPHATLRTPTLAGILSDNPYVSVPTISMATSDGWPSPVLQLHLMTRAVQQAACRRGRQEPEEEHTNAEAHVVKMSSLIGLLTYKKKSINLQSCTFIKKKRNYEDTSTNQSCHIHFFPLEETKGIKRRGLGALFLG